MDFLIKALADWSLLPIVIIAVWVLLINIPNDKKLATYSRILLAGLTAYFLAKLASLIYQPAEMRPFEILGVSAGASFMNNPGFPSDHVLFAMAITLAVWFGYRHKLVVCLLFGLTLLVCVGRVVALVHTPLDVVGGLLFAILGGVWYLPFRLKK